MHVLYEHVLVLYEHVCAGFVIYVSIILTVLMALATFLYTTYKFQVVTIAVLTISHGISILVGLFAQKLYFMVRHPERNNSDALMRRTSTTSLHPALLLSTSSRRASIVALEELEKVRAASLVAAVAAAPASEACTRKCSLNCAHCEQLERTQLHSNAPPAPSASACPKRTMSERSLEPERGTAHGAGTRYTPARQRHVSVDQVKPSTGAVGRYLTRSRQATSEELETRRHSIDEADADAHSHQHSVSVVSITSIQSDSAASSGVFARAARTRLSTSSGTSLNTITESDSVIIREIEQPAPGERCSCEAELATGAGTRLKKRSREQREVTFADLLTSDLSTGTTIARKRPSSHTDSSF